MTTKFNYSTHLDIKFKHFELIDIPQMVKEVKDKWFNQTLAEVNGSVVRVGIVEGEYHLPLPVGFGRQAGTSTKMMMNSFLFLKENFLLISGNPSLREKIEQ